MYKNILTCNCLGSGNNRCNVFIRRHLHGGFAMLVWGFQTHKVDLRNLFFEAVETAAIFPHLVVEGLGWRVV